ncbi:MAG: hypothetical protein AUH84_07365 [Thaumarchaeota archaeon 13_1_40CM_4_38_7]|nr:MAG: hypothetical protein AUH84_07365 [Thaumarchaeota archaeon 13_1_40CM_4_38_7]OLC93258.1 MAG: hypothetical protein AUI92_03310 [Thaumarchaeota archaeon 13_1_40CM_3_38_6]
MKTSLVISTGILCVLVLFLSLSSVSLQIIGNLLFMIILLAAAMIIGTYFNAVKRVKSEIEKKISKKSNIFSRQRKISESELSKFYIHNYKKIERKPLKCFKLFISIWGISTSVAATAVQIGIFIGIDKLPQMPFKPLFQIPSQYVMNIPSPTTPESFIFWTYLFCVPMAVGILAPAMLLRTANLRYMKDDGMVIPIAKYNLDIIGGIGGVISSTFLFFNDVGTSLDMQIKLLNYVIVDLIIIGIPIAIFCLFYVWHLESKLKPQILSYLHNELHIRVEN